MPARKSTSSKANPSKTAAKASSTKTPAKSRATSSSAKTPVKSSWKKTEVLADYRLARLSREVSLLGRKEVLNGRAKFGIFGDGKELPQIALSKVFHDGDFRSGYYRDQTLLMAIGQLTPQQLFAQLYAHVDTAHEPHSSGRQMTAHFGTQLVDEDGEWLPQTSMKNSASDISCTAGQMARLLGLAQASSLYRAERKLAKHTQFSKKGNEIAFGTIGDASTSEGVFWEALNAAGVLQVPIVMSVWDDGYGISVSKKYQTTKESISELLQGFQRTTSKPGLEILKTKAWDYEELVATYQKAASLARKEHVPVVVHVEEVTQPQGHSTSGSHERYKSKERLAWESKFCCNTQFRQWILEKKLATSKELDALDAEVLDEVKSAQKEAWKAFQEPLKAEKEAALAHLDALKAQVPEQASILEDLATALKRKNPVIRKDSMVAARRALMAVKGDSSEATQALSAWIEAQSEANHDRYNSHWISETKYSPLNVTHTPADIAKDAPTVDGRVVLRDNFQTLFDRHPEMVVFGEDSGQLGDVNLGLEGMQERFGIHRVFDTGIRETTILGQGIGMAMRGLRPIAEIQYLDYLLYAFQTLSDDVASLRYRTKGRQRSPVIVRTRGHRLEGIWHSGSPMGMILNGIRGVHLCVPRNLTEAAGFYNTLIQGDDPALVIEPLNGYRLKEKMPSNLGDFTTPLGIPEVVQEGTDITLVSYGSTFNVVMAAQPLLQQAGISAECIDVRTLLPFDIEHRIGASLQKTNRILFIDEDVPGGATAFMMQHVLDEQGGYRFLDSQAECLTAKPHRPAYSTDGDYFSKPSVEDVFDAVYEIMHESDPAQFP